MSDVQPPQDADPLSRYLERLTDEVLERTLLSSTPKGDVAGRELRIDLSKLSQAEFHAVGRLVGASEGFVRRGGSVQITPPPRRATAEEARRLATPITAHTSTDFRTHQKELARSVQDRIRVSRFLQRVGFLDSVRCTHLGDPRVSIQAVPELAFGREPAEQRVRASPLEAQAKVLTVVPYRWFKLGTPEDFRAVVKHTNTVLIGMGVKRDVRTAVEELALNVLEHSLYGDEGVRVSGPPHILFGASTTQTTAGMQLEILVVDGGVGIPATLDADFRRSHGRIGSQSEVLAHAFEPSSTRKQREHVEGSARGLAVVLNAVRNGGGSLRVRSGSGEVELRDGALTIEETRDGFQPGTAFSFTIPFYEALPRRRIGGDADLVVSSTLDVDVHVVRRNGSSSRLIALGPSRHPAANEVTFVFVEPGCSRANLEQSLLVHITADATLVVASTDGQGSLLRNQIEAVLAASSPSVEMEILVLDGLEPVSLGDHVEPRAARGLVRAVVERFASHLARSLAAVVDETPVAPRLTWSLEIAARWIEPKRLIDHPEISVLAPMVLAFGAAQQLAEDDASDLAIRDVIVTDRAFHKIGDAVAGWLSAPHVRRIRVPQEPDSALLVDEIEAASVVLTSIIHGGGATTPIVRGLLAGGRRSIAVCCLLDSRQNASSGLGVAGHQVPVVAALTSSSGPPAEIAGKLERDALHLIGSVLAGEGDDTEFYRAVAASPGALSLGHFHSENRAWMSAVIAPSAIADPATPVGRLILDRLIDGVEREIEALFPHASVYVQDLAEPTLLTGHLRRALRSTSGGEPGKTVTVLVDWGALTGGTVVRGALSAAQEGASGVVVAVGVDRSFSGPHHLLHRSTMTLASTEAGRLPMADALPMSERQVGLSFVSAVEFPRDHRSEVDCPMCATERSLVQARSMPTPLLNSRLRMLRVRTSSDPPRTETVDGFGCPMPSDEVELFLRWRGVVHRGVHDRRLAHGVTLRLEGGEDGLEPPDLIALARNLVLNADLLRRRPWSSPRFRHALAEALSAYLVSNAGSAISSSMARQLVTVLRMASKTIFVRRAGRIHGLWLSTDVREEIELAMATALRDNMSEALLESVAAAVAEFEDGWPNDEVPLSVGALRSEILRVRARRRGELNIPSRWQQAQELLGDLTTHMGLGGALARLPILIANLHEPEAVARDTLVEGALRHLHEIERFVAVDYPSILTLVEEEFEPLVRRGVADQLPNQGEWLGAVRRLIDALTGGEPDGGRTNSDLSDLVRLVTEPLDASSTSKTFASLVLGASSDPAEIAEDVRSAVDRSQCLVTGPTRTGRVLFPGLLLNDLLVHLVENGIKHREHEHLLPEVHLDLRPGEEDMLHRHLRVAYRRTSRSSPENDAGGLSHYQWGGAVAAFGGLIEVVPPAPGETYALDILFQRPWGDAS